MGERVRERPNGFRERRAGRYSGVMVRTSRLRSWFVELAVAVGAGAFLGLLGPFGSFGNGSPLVRVTYWITALLLGGAVYGAAFRLSLQASRRWRAPWLPVFASAAVLATFPVAYFSQLWAAQFWPVVAGIGFWPWWGECLLIAAPLSGLYGVIGWKRLNSAKPTAPIPPTRFGRDVICLQMEDHYVRVHTPRGSELLLMRLSDAMARTTRPGLQVHRSWWVARDAVQEVVRDGRNLRLRLVNGLEAPVARRSVSQLKAAGLTVD